MAKLIKKPFVLTTEPQQRQQFAELPAATLLKIVEHRHKQCIQHNTSKMLKTRTTIIWPNGDATHRIVDLEEYQQVAVFIRKAREALKLGGQILINKLET